MSQNMVRQYARNCGHDQSRCNLPVNEGHETMPSHMEENKDNYDFFKQSPHESSTKAENSGLGGLDASFHTVEGKQEMHFESSEEFFAKQLDVQKFVPAPPEEPAAGQDYSTRSEPLEMLLQIHDHNMQENETSCEDTSPSVTTAGFASLDLSERPETGRGNTLPPPVSGHDLKTTSSPGQDSTLRSLDARRRRCSLIESVAKRFKAPAPPEPQCAFNRHNPKKTEASKRVQSRGNSERFICPECQHPCRDGHNLKEHRKKHSTVKSFFCMLDGCTKATKRFRDLLRHRREKHNEVQQLHICPHCSKTYKRADYLKKHLEKKHP